MTKYKCPTLGDCDKANSGEIFERAPGEDLKCPGCGMALEPQMTSLASTGSRKVPIMLAGAAVFILVVGGGYSYIKSTATVVAPVVATAPAVTEPLVAAPVIVPAVAPGPDFAQNTGIAPSDAETKELRIKGDIQLVRGDAAEAELASSKAAANELLKVAIAKMAQGKFDDAERDLAEAKARAPKQPLVSYNTGVLRLKQGRTDDALNEFEASFSAGFSYFDKLEQDRDLDNIRKNSRFVELLAKYRPLVK